jgi:hypothetical protein
MHLMSEKRPKIFWLSALAYVILAGGVVSTGFDFYNRPEMAIPQDMGVVLGNGAFVLLGLVTSAVATVLRNLEMRLDRIERQGGSEETRISQE